MQQFEKVIVIGYGKIVKDVLQHIINEKEKYGYDIEYIEHELSTFSVMETICSNKSIPYHLFPNRAQVKSYLDKEKKRTLIISAGNNYIFPKDIVGRENFVIINFHNALLPKYPGRNAPSWAIYLGETESGATWHYVTEKVDEGKCICQKKCIISEDTKAYELTKNIMDLAFEGLKENFENILFDKIEGIPQNINNSQRKMYYSYEIPGDGRFDLLDDVNSIYRLLRATDYGKNSIFPKMRTRLPDGNEVEILSYRKDMLSVPPDTDLHIDMEKRSIFLVMDNSYLLKLKYKILENKEKT